MFKAFRKTGREGLAGRIITLLLIIPVGYLVLVNLLLNVGLLPALISAKPDLIKVGWSSAWSPWPGRAYVRGFHLRAQERDLQWEVHVDEAHTFVALGSLFKRRFETRWVQAKGVDFRLRPRLVQDEDLATLSAAFPKIAGFTDPPLALIGPKQAKTEAQALAEWSVRLEQVQVEGVRELWLGPYRAVVDLSVQGRLFVHPDNFLQVGPAKVQLRRGEVFQGSLKVAQGLLGNIEATIDMPQFRDVQPLEVLGALNAKVNLKANDLSIDLLNYHLLDRSHPELHGTKGTLTLGLGLANGYLASGSRIVIEGGEVSADVPGYRMRGGWNAEGVVTEKDGALHSHFELRVSPVRLERDEGSRVFETPLLKATVEASNVVIGQTPKDTRLVLHLAPSEPFPLESLNGLMATDDFRFVKGTASVSAHLSLGPGVKSPGGFLVVRSRNTQVNWGTTHLKADALVNVDSARMKLARKSADLSGSSVKLSKVEVVGSRTRLTGWEGTVNLDNAAIRLGTPKGFVADIDARFSDGRPFLALFGDEAGLPGWATPLLAAEGLTVNGNLALVGSALSVRGLRAEGRGLQLRGQLDRDRERLAGLFLVKVRGMGIGLRMRGPRLESQVLEPEAWFENQLLSVRQ